MRNYEFDAAKTKDEIITWIRNYFRKNGPDCNAVVGISGGKDSSIVAALCCEALGNGRALLARGRIAGLCDSKQARVNLPARIRMATLFMVSQSMNGRVANTSNFSEDYVGFATLFGDGAGQFSPLGKLTVTEVKAVGRELGLPEKFIEKAPADGLTGKTDEDNFGFTYDFLDKYIRTGDFGGDTAIAAKIDRMHDANTFKLLPMSVYNSNPFDW